MFGLAHNVLHYGAHASLFSFLQGGMGAALLSDPDKIEAVSTDKHFQSLYLK